MNPYLLSGLENGVAILERLVRQLPPEAWDEPTGPGRFTPCEVLAHLADWEPIFLARMRQAVASPGSEVEVFDEGERAASLGYAAWDAQDSLAKWRAARTEVVAWVRTLSPEQFALGVSHPERGPMSVADMANMLLGHDLYHIEQLSATALR